MKTSDKLIEAFEKFRPHINGHRTSIDLFLEALKEVEVMEQELSKLHQPTVSEQVNEVGMEGHENGCGCWMCNDLRGE
jgi:hypothetical protein